MPNKDFVDDLEKNTHFESTSLYLFIIWEKSRKKSDMIFDDMNKKFVIRDVYEVTWDRKQFIDNMRRFYGTLETAQQKSESFGSGPFLLILVTDPNPKLIEMETPKGVEIINLNILDSKKLYRKWIGRDFAVHSSVSEKESDHNMTLFFGKSTKTLDDELPKNWNGIIKKLNSDLIGANGWENIKQLFNVLNGLYYVILRNFENLPDQLNQKDIDFLTGTAMIIQIITPNYDTEVNVPTTNVGNEKIIFDYKNAKDHYFDRKWSEKILKRRVLHPNGFYVPCKEDHFYTLLYHVIIQKPSSFSKYRQKLSLLAKELSVNNVNEQTFNDFHLAEKILIKYLHKMKYGNTKSFQYRFFYFSILRYVTTSIFLIKTKGLKHLFSVIKIKLKHLR